MKHKLVFTTFLALSAMTVSATAAVTAPVGLVELTFPKEADTPFSLPMNRAKVFAGKYSSQSGNVVTIASNDLTAGAYNEGTIFGEPNRTFYILFTSGTLAGRSFDIVSNTVNSITVAQDGEDNLQTLINDPFARDNFEIRAHWTLNTLFPDGAGFPAAANRFANSSLIQFKPNNLDGENHAVSKSYKYVTNVGWIDTSQLFGATVNDMVLARDTHFIFKNTTGTEVTKNVVGDVPTTKGALKLRAHVIKQDNYVAFNFPKSLTLDDTGFEASATFVKTTNRFSQNGDLLLVFPDTPDDYNTAPVKGYFFLAGTGWIDNTNLFGPAVPGSTDLNTIGRAFIIKKAGNNDDAETLFESITRPYNPFAE